MARTARFWSDIGRVNDDIEEAGMTSETPGRWGAKAAPARPVSVSPAAFSCTLRFQYLPPTTIGPAPRVPHPT
jgi:hypothetical protein